MTKTNHRQRSKYRETLLVIVLGFALLSITRFGRDWMLYVALGTGVLGMLSIHLNRWIHQAWFFIGDKLGFVVSKVVLGDEEGISFEMLLQRYRTETRAAYDDATRRLIDSVR